MRYFLPTLLLLFFCSAVSAQKVETLSNSNKESEIRSNLYEKPNIQLPDNAGIEELKEAIFAQKPFLSNLGCDLLLESAIESPGGKHYNFAQAVNGIPIYQASIKANLSRGNRIMSFLNDLHSFSGAIPAFTMNSNTVEDVVQQKLDEGFSDFKIFQNRKAYFLENNELRAAHWIQYTSNTMTWEVLFADVDFSELLRRDLAAYRKSITGTTGDSTGTGMVFNPDPLTTSAQVYGGAYTDNNDNDSPELNNQRQQIILRNINWNGTNFELKGPYVNLQDREAPTTAIATSTTGNFNFTRSEQGFEDVMVYYHIDTFQRYVQSLGFMNLQNGPIIADPHGLNSQDNSHFVPAGIDSRLGFGEGGVDDAEDADVIIHEYGHALSYAGSPGTNSGSERQGLDEGLGDYFAASYSRGISYTFWKNTFTWDGHNEFWPGRSASDPTTYPPSSSSDIYRYGSIWASTLMEVYDVIGKTASDKVILQSLYGNSSNMTLTDAALIVIDADSMLYGGAHHDQYQTAFCNRGILSGTLQGQGCWVANDDFNSEFGAWTAFPNPANQLLEIDLSSMPNGKYEYVFFDLMGRALLSGNVQGVAAKIDLTSIPAGSYILSLRQSNGKMDSKQIVIAR